MRLQDHVRVARQEHHEEELLRLVRQPDDVLVGEDLEQQHEHCDQMQEIPNQLEDVHIKL